MSNQKQSKSGIKHSVQRLTKSLNSWSTVQSEKAKVRRKAAYKHIESNDNRLVAVMEVIRDLHPTKGLYTIQSATLRAQASLDAQRWHFVEARDDHIGRFVGQAPPTLPGVDLGLDKRPQVFGDTVADLHQPLLDFRGRCNGYTVFASISEGVHTTMIPLDDIVAYQMS